MIKLPTLRSDLIFLETQAAVILKDTKIEILDVFQPKDSCYSNDCSSLHPPQF